MSNVTPVDLSESMAETRRRQKATVTGGESTLDDNSGYTRPFQADDQKFVLWNLANQGLAPKAPMPAFRLLGLFPDVESTMAHAEQVMAMDKSCALRMATTHEWYTIPKSDKPIEDCQAKVNRNLLRHQELLQNNAVEFKQRHDALTEGRTPAIEQAKDAQEQVEREERQRQKRKQIVEAAVENDDEKVEELKNEYEKGTREELESQELMRLKEGKEESKDDSTPGEIEVKKDEYVEPKLVAPVDPESLNANWEEKVKEFGSGPRPPAVSRMLEVRNQRYAVISVVKDYESAQGNDPVGEEPGVIVWAAFDTEEEAVKYNKVVASKQLRDHDLAIVSMYEWLFPHMMNSDRVEQLYRNEELNNIMKQARISSTRVREFEEMCEREGIECPATEVEPDLAEAAPRKWQPPVGSGLDTEGSDMPVINVNDIQPDV
jgi:anti-sigma28 factor (negative regulator of flagellin synthesis)